MDKFRRESIRELIGMLGYIGERVEDLVLEEEGTFEVRSAPSKETELGIVSKEAAQFLNGAADGIENAIEQLRSAVGDDSQPEPAPPTINRRGL
jgi:hypothetical protein